MKVMKWNMGTVGALLLVLAGVVGFGCKGNEPPKTNDPVVTDNDTTPPATVKGGADDPVWIKVNGQDVYKSDVDREKEEMARGMGGQVPPEFENTLKRVSMQRAAQRKLLELVVAEAGIELDPGELAEAITAEKAPYPDPTVFEGMLKERGITEDEFEKEIATRLRFEKYFDKMVPVPTPTDEEIAVVYEEEKAKNVDGLKQPPKASVVHIFFRFMGDDAEKQKKRDLAAATRKRIEAGEDMEAIAMELSDSPSRSNSGKESFMKGQMGGDFDTVVFGLKDGDLSPVIESPIGCHLVKVLTISPERVMELAELKDQIVEYLKMKNKRELYPKYMDELIASAKLEFIEPLPEELPPGHPGMSGGNTAGNGNLPPGHPDINGGATAAPEAPTPPGEPPAPAPTTPAPPTPGAGATP